MRDEALAECMPAEKLLMLPDPLSAARVALENAQSSDALVLLAFIQRREILQLVHEFMS